jgi:hypothetical protein
LGIQAHKKRLALSLALGFSPVIENQTRNETVSTVSFIVPFQSIFLDKDLKLIAERPLPMMFFLRRNVGGDSLDIRMRNRECSVATAPGELSAQEFVFIYPM